MELKYKQEGDYLIPDLEIDEQIEQPLTKYGMMRKKYLEEHRSGMFAIMILNGNLWKHCLEIQEQAEQRMDILVEQMAKAQGVNEELKATDQMKWVGLMNNIRHSAEEIVVQELIYA